MISTKLRKLETLSKEDLRNKKVILRLDLNLPRIRSGVYDPTRVDLSMPTIKLLSESGARIFAISHFGRPRGSVDMDFSLKPVFSFIQKKISREIRNSVVFASLESLPAVKEGGMCVLENLRFHKGEEENSPDFAKLLAETGDMYVNEAFSVSHRAHASMQGVARILPSYAGLHLSEEIRSLEQLLLVPQRPLVAAIGGNKLETKIKPIRNLIKNVNSLLIGGALSNTFLKAQGSNIGQSHYEEEHLEEAKSIIHTCRDSSCKLILPRDAIVSGELSSHVAKIGTVSQDEKIFDIGPETLSLFKRSLNGTLVWNGPFGVLEKPAFAQGTLRFAMAAAEKTTKSKLVSIAGGGETISALNQIGALSQLTHVSSGGGAFLAWLGGDMLPGIEPLIKTE